MGQQVKARDQEMIREQEPMRLRFTGSSPLQTNSFLEPDWDLVGLIMSDGVMQWDGSRLRRHPD
jgi:hypothetical protein